MVQAGATKICGRFGCTYSSSKVVPGPGAPLYGGCENHRIAIGRLAKQYERIGFRGGAWRGYAHVHAPSDSANPLRPGEASETRKEFIQQALRGIVLVRRTYSLEGYDFAFQGDTCTDGDEKPVLDDRALGECEYRVRRAG